MTVVGTFINVLALSFRSFVIKLVALTHVTALRVLTAGVGRARVQGREVTFRGVSRAVAALPAFLTPASTVCDVTRLHVQRVARARVAAILAPRV